MDNEPLFIFEEDTKKYKELLANKAHEAEEFSSALGQDVTILERDQTSSVACFNIERQKYFDYKGKVDFSVDSMSKMEQKINAELRRDVYANLEMDLFNALYKDTPTIHANDRMKEPFDEINKMVRDIISSPEIEDIKHRTTYSPMQSLMAQEEIYRQILYKYEEKLNNQQQRLDTNNEIEEIKDLMDALQNMPGADGKLNELQQQLDGLNELKNGLDNINKNIDNKNKKNGNANPSSGIDYDQLKQDLDDAEDLMSSYGVDSGEEITKMSDVEKKNVADLMRLVSNKKTLKKLLDILGSMKDVAISVTKKNISKFGFVPTDVKTGNDIPKLVQSEKLMLAHNVTKSQFYKKYSEKQLLEYETQDIQGKGPIIVCRDISGSMGYRSRNEWACAIALSVLQSAKIQKRDVYILNYTERVKSETEYIAGSKDMLNKSIEVSLVSPNGGTSFIRVLNRVTDIINKSRYKKASVLMLTDGDGGLDADTYKMCKRVFKEKDVEMRTIFIGDDNPNKRLIELSESINTIYDNQMSSFKSYESLAVSIFDTLSK